jgi:hypothetical protein
LLNGAGRRNYWRAQYKALGLNQVHHRRKI